MSEIDWDAMAAVRERVGRKLEAERLAADRLRDEARQLREASEASGQVVRSVTSSRHYGLDVASFHAQADDGWHAEVCVIPAGLSKVITEAIHECRERLASELLGRLRKVARPDGTWPEAETTRVVRAWLLDHGSIP